MTDEARVLQVLAEATRGPMKPKEIAQALRISTPDYRRFKRLLTGLEAAGKVYRVKGHRYGLPGSLELTPGVISLTRAGDGFIRADTGDTDLFVPSSNLGTAMEGDRVVARIEARPRGRNPVARVIKVLERARDTVVGTFHTVRRVNHVVPMDSRLTQPILIADGDTAGACDGDVVVVRIESYGEGRLGPVGAVSEVLGPISDPGVDVLAVGHGFGISFDFPASVSEAAERATRVGLAEPGAGRVDRRDLLVFTIDPADAKDHDDALSIVPSSSGRFEVGVHIADVSHFVREGDPVDIEALERGTSVYLVDRTIPMLPEVLSANVCSLHEGEDRFAISLFMELDKNGTVHAHRYEETNIRCAHSLSYEDVQEVLDEKAQISPVVDDTIRKLDEVARGVRARRAERGSLDLDLPEAKVILDERGVPIDIRRRDRLASHRLIEDFMILANEVVATDMETRKIPTLYRVHEPPAEDRMEDLRELLGRIGHGLAGRNSVTPGDLQQLLDSVAGRPEAELVSSVVLRSLSKARYDPRNLGHFGLASPAYLHFTSPIRRYPDLVVHREVVASLVRGNPPREWDADELRSVAERTSSREVSAAEAERASIAMKKVEFMEQHLGDEFDGRISGVTAFGFFVTLEKYFVDGLVHVNSLRDDFYRLQQEAYALVGDRGRRRYRLGDRVRVQVVRVDKEARHVDFLLADAQARTN
ncbi:MAG: ribonuclease R [Gemmatimonadetes bacterium]|nr:ribonuclease R [Gemmatimonadota bacterium]